MKYLLQHFPATSGRLIVRGYGKIQPIASNETPEGRSQNRRVQITSYQGSREREGRGFTDFRDGSNYTTEDLARALFPSEADIKPRGLGRLPSIPPRETGRAFLVGNQPEDRGYGLYSYLLFGSPPTDITRNRYRAAITTYLELIPARIALEEFLPRDQLNITYLPLKVHPPERLSPKEHTDWILQYYNYTRARVLLSALPGTHREGPYIASSPKPLSSAKLLFGPYLYQDLSSVPPRLVELWVKEFLNQVGQERFEKKRIVEQLVLKLRTAIAILAEGLPEVQEAFAEWGKERMNVQEAINQRIGGKR